MAARLEVRLDEERKQRLDTLVATAGIPTSEVVRRMIDEAWEAMMLERRKAAVERLAALEVEDVPDPDVLSRQLVKDYEPLP